jgi:hypothetical protein
VQPALAFVDMIYSRGGGTRRLARGGGGGGLFFRACRASSHIGLVPGPQALPMPAAALVLYKYIFAHASCHRPQGRSRGAHLRAQRPKASQESGLRPLAFGLWCAQPLPPPSDEETSSQRRSSAVHAVAWQALGPCDAALRSTAPSTGASLRRWNGCSAHPTVAACGPCGAD